MQLFGRQRRSDVENVERMRAIPLFGDLTDRQIDQLDSVLSEAHVPLGRRLTATGRPGRQFAIVVDGLAAVVRGRIEVARLEHHDFFGEHALLTDRPCSADVIALTDMRLLVAGPAEFDRMCRISPAIHARVSTIERQRSRVQARPSGTRVTSRSDAAWVAL